jgi:hypothetical protein
MNGQAIKFARMRIALARPLAPINQDAAHSPFKSFLHFD